ncbi:MAG TPA: calcium/sodium antiporter [Calditrichia bacterium]|nr:calcium/sodium antiporter [Calditrichia bacterium]
MLTEFFLLIIGLTMLWVGAELLVRYVSALARSVGVSHLVLGLTVVSLGTSLPELVVSVLAVLQGDDGISIGNIIGSNVANIALILGVGALIVPLGIRMDWIRREVPYMILVTGTFYFFSWTGGTISRLEGMILLGMLLFFLLYLGRDTLQDMDEFKEMAKSEEVYLPRKTRLAYLGLTVLGIAILLVGSKLSVDSGTDLAVYLGVNDSIIGLTLIALGTSLPELATTVVSAMRGEADLAVGNVVGSNIFNLALIGGLPSLIHPLHIAGEANMLSVELPFLMGLSILLWPLMRNNLDIRRYEGIILLTIYGGFLWMTIH